MKKEEIIGVLLNIADNLDTPKDDWDYIFESFKHEVKAIREAAHMIAEMNQREPYKEN